MADDVIIATVVSPQGRTVEITEASWGYIQAHVEMRGELDLLLEAIQAPTSRSRTRALVASATGFAPKLRFRFGG